MFCNKCGAQLDDDAKFCGYCGNVLRRANAAPSPEISNPTQAFSATSAAPAQAMPAQAQSIESQPIMSTNNSAPVIQKNSIGTAGFVLALVAFFTSWIPILGWLLWIVGVILSVIGIIKKPRGLAIAGTVISFIDLILLIFVIGFLASIGLALS